MKKRVFFKKNNIENCLRYLVPPFFNLKVNTKSIHSN